jgi:ribosomal protein S18 acetylase RimI-like enzyme
VTDVGAMEPPTRIRTAERRDAGALARLAESTFREAFGAANTPANMDAHCAAAYGEAIQAAEIADSAAETLLVERGGELIAYAQLRRGPSPPFVPASSPVEIRRFYVDRSWHGRGVAQQLMTHLLSSVGRAGADVVWLGVWEHNPRAIAFYTRWGFLPAGDQVFELGSDPQRDLVLARPLGREDSGGAAGERSKVNERRPRERTTTIR